MAKNVEKGLLIERIIDLVTLVFMFIMLTKYTLFLITQSFYVHLIDKQSRSSDNNAVIEIQAQIVRIQKLMSNTGSIYRKTGTTGIILYSIIVSSSFTYCAIRLIFNNKIVKEYFSQGLISFIMFPEKEVSRISVKIDEIVDLIILSNLNHATITLESNSLNQIYSKDRERFKSNGPSTVQRLKGIESKFQILHSLIEKIYLNLSRSYNGNDGVVHGEYNQHYQKLAMIRQLDHLISLFYDKSSVWPIIRTPDWTEQLKAIVIKLIIGTRVSYCLFSLVLFQASIDSAFTAIQNHSLDSEAKHFNQLDRITVVDVIIGGFIIVDEVCSLIVLLIIIIIDQMKQIRFLNKKLASLVIKLNQIVLAQTNYTRMSQESVYQCDIEAIDLYIIFQLYKKDLTLGLKLAQFLISLQVSYVLLIISPVLFYFYHLPAEQNANIAPPVMVILIWLFTLNLPFIFFAKLHVASLICMKRVWSFLATTRAFSKYIIEYDHEMISFVEHTENNRSRKMSLQVKSRNVCPVTTHTILLWKRLIENKDNLLENFQVKIVKIIDLDYNGILRMNFWLISMILIVITYATR